MCLGPLVFPKRSVVLSKMKKYDMNLMAGVTLVFLSVAFQNTLADKNHWNPQRNPEYHSYKYQNRKKEDVIAKIDYQGWNYAGRGEFPWLVEIRGKDTENFDEQENWSNGNLVSSKFVLTVCYAVVTIRKYEQGQFTHEDPLFRIGVDQTYLGPRNPKSYKVLYSDDYTYKSVGNGHYTGTRQVKRFIPHPRCNQFELDYHWGVVEIKRPIWPVPPWTSYMPIDFDRKGFANIKKKYTETKESLAEASRCSVGLWSRKISAEYDDKETGEKLTFSNDKLLNYKIKYSVINVNPKDCSQKPGIDALPAFIRVGQPLQELECMGINSNETLGAVCDHDRGAPIVCDGVVRAVVVVGATKAFCSINKPYPFLVMDIRFAFEMFAESSIAEWGQARLRYYMRANT